MHYNFITPSSSHPPPLSPTTLNHPPSQKVREKGCKKCATAKRVDKRWRIFPFKHNGAESTGVTASHVANAADSTADSWYFSWVDSWKLIFLVELIADSWVDSWQLIFSWGYSWKLIFLVEFTADSWVDSWQLILSWDDS